SFTSISIDISLNSFYNCKPITKMSLDYITDKDFETIDFTQNDLPKGDYENCNFTNCDFSNSNLSEIKFSECKFMTCNISLVDLNKTAFRSIRFKDCKMLGLHFERCNEFGFEASFENCLLDHSSFYKMKLKKTVFKNSKLEEVDFTETDLSA